MSFQRTIAAIPTTYNGTTFRSRLEARYAVMFDHMGITWFYEPEGFRLSDGAGYLPDFWIEQGQFFAEVRPAPDAFDPRQAQFCNETGNALALLDGDPEVKAYRVIEPGSTEDNCPTVSFDMDFYSTRDENRLFTCPEQIDKSRSLGWQSSDRLRESVTAALNAIFE